ncbi:MAG TPA: FAD-linked oxidase C-terminal domain-containing protein [Anaerolineales bacterium]
MALNPDVAAELRKRISGELRLDRASRILYSTDASIYQIEPLGVLFPRNSDDLQAAVELAARYRIPIIARGAGTSLAGQAIGEGLIVDCSRWLDRILAIDAERGLATVEPGVVLADLNREAGRHGLQFGPDPASAERATMGGVVASNGTGAHSVVYGMAADHVVSSSVLLSDGTRAVLGPVADGRGPNREVPARLQTIMDATQQIRTQCDPAIKSRFPRTWRNSAGYRLNYLLPWAPSAPTGWAQGEYPTHATGDGFNLAQLLAGSEGTLAVMQDITVALVRKPKHTILGILAYDDEAAACDSVPALLNLGPSAIELVPRLILRAARRIPEYARQMTWVQGDPAAILIMEFAGQLPDVVKSRAGKLGEAVQLVSKPEDQAMVWATRKAGLGLLDSSSGPRRPISFIEDCAIPVDVLGEFVREIRRVMESHGALGGIYGHASAGCLHIRPVLDLKSGEGVRSLRQIAEETLSLAVRLGGSMSSEHGDGIARGEWLKRTYGDELINAMRELKRAADPEGIFNPGKMFEAPPMDTHLRFGQAYRARAWTPGMDFANRGGLALAIEKCNGQGVCRKDAGVMCPSFQATRDEMHSTRGRANLLRALITVGTNPAMKSMISPGGEGASQTNAAGLQASVHQALDLCLACKGCTAECPSGVDMPRLKSAFLELRYAGRLRPLRDYVFGYFGLSARVLSVARPLVIAATKSPTLRSVAMRAMGISPARPLPDFGGKRTRRPHSVAGPLVLLVRDPYSHFVDAATENAAILLLEAAGYRIRCVDVLSAGAALISKGFLRSAGHHARRLLDGLKRADTSGTLPCVFLEPSELSAVQSEYRDLIPGISAADSARFAEAQSVEQLLATSEGFDAMHKPTGMGRVLFHPHCHEKAGKRIGKPAATEPFAGMTLLRKCGYEVELVDAGCCGMGGTFGYEAEHYELAQKIGGLRLFPQIAAHADAYVAATGGSCRLQIQQGTGREAQHPLVLAARALQLI